MKLLKAEEANLLKCLLQTLIPMVGAMAPHFCLLYFNGQFGSCTRATCTRYMINNVHKKYVSSYMFMTVHMHIKQVDVVPSKNQALCTVNVIIII